MVDSGLTWILIGTLVFWATTGRNHEESAYDARQRLQDLQIKQDSDQNFKIRAIQDGLKVLESAVVEILKANPKQPDSEVVPPAVGQDKSAGNAEAVSDEDFRAMVLKSAKHKERMAIAKHFKQEKEFKASLSRTEKKKFDAEVKKAYENLLAESGLNGV